VEEAALFGFEHVSSLAVDPGRPNLFLSDGNATYALVLSGPEPSLLLVLPDVGGELAVCGDDLWILSHDLQGLYRIEGLGKQLQHVDDANASYMRELRGS
jgi:hypothetical protein